MRLLLSVLITSLAALAIMSCQQKQAETVPQPQPQPQSQPQQPPPPLSVGSTAATSQVTSTWKAAVPAGAAVVITAGTEWRAIDMCNPDIATGSALDFSRWWDGRPAGSHGRVIVNAQGRLAFTDNPEKRAVFWGCAVNMGPGGSFGLRHDISTINGDHAKTPLTKDDIAAFARRMRIQGYNLFRPHFLDSALMEGAKADQDFDPAALDRFDWLVACLKDNGIYLYLDAMTRTGGWSHGNGWAGDGVNRKVTLYDDASARELWRERVGKLLARVNPYTGTKLSEDPQVVMILFCNEQEIDPWGLEHFPAELLPGFRRWLATLYANDAALRTAWTDAAGKCWLPAEQSLTNVTAERFWGDSPRSRDINRYIYLTEIGMLAWYESTIRTMGYQGITSQFDCGMRYRDSHVRAGLQAVSIHAYAAPIGGTGWITPGGKQSPHSSIGAPDTYRDLLYVRYTTSARYLDRPLLVTEYDHEFWNPYRHERGLAMAGYAALQDYDALIPHAHPVMLSVDRPTVTYYVGSDPIGRATEVVSGLLFTRRDVTPAKGRVAIGLNERFLFDQGRSGGGLVWEKDQDRLSLITGFGISTTDAAGKTHGLVPGTIALPIGDLPPTGELIARLKRDGVLAADNRSDPATGVFESEGGQLLMQRARSQLDLNTARSQGATLLAGASAQFPVLAIQQVSVNAAITLHALDREPLATSRRMLLVIATDALNSDMAFKDAGRTELLSIGNAPCLIRCGQFKLGLTTPHAGGLAVWGLGMDGRRMERLPTTLAGTQLSLTLDTAQTKAPYLFYEVVLSDAP